MAINYRPVQQPVVQQKKKSGGIMDFIMPAAAIAGGTAAMIGTGGAAAPAVAGGMSAAGLGSTLGSVAGGLGAAGGSMQVKQIIDERNKKPEAQPVQGPQLSQPGDAMTRRMMQMQEDPYNIMKQGMVAAAELPPALRQEVMPGLFQGFMSAAQKRSV